MVVVMTMAMVMTTCWWRRKRWMWWCWRGGRGRQTRFWRQGKVFERPQTLSWGAWTVFLFNIGDWLFFDQGARFETSAEEYKIVSCHKKFFYLLLKQMAASNCGVVEISLQATHLFELQQLTNQEQQRKNSTRSKSNTLSRVRPNTCHKLHRVKVTVDHRSCLRCTPLDISIYLLIIICPAVCGSFLSQRLLCLYIWLLSGSQTLWLVQTLKAFNVKLVFVIKSFQSQFDMHWIQL